MDAGLARMNVDREQRAETTTLIAALVLALVALVAIAALSVSDPRLPRSILLQWSAQLLLGKETGIPTALALGLPIPLVVLAGSAQDAFLLLAGYALALRAARGALKLRWLQRRLPAAVPVPGTRRSEPLGVTLLALTIWIPFLPTGALVAALAGRAIGYRTRILLPALLVSIVMSHMAYTLLYAHAFAAIDPRVVLVLAALIAAAIAFIYSRKAARSSP